jgi:hypothetical protein
MESNAMLSCCGVIGDSDVDTDVGDLITGLLLDDVGIVQGACPQTAFNEQVLQVEQRRHRNARCADLHVRADDRVQHPRRYNRDYAGRHFNVDDSPRGALLDAAQPDLTPVQRVPTIMNFNFLPDMGRMSM